MGFMSKAYRGHSAEYRTPIQQRNVQAKQAETNNYAYQARMGGAAGSVNTPEQGKRNMQPPAAPQMHPVVAQNKRQFGSVSSSLMGAMKKLRTLKRLTK